jgi:hypothetical protein
MGGVISGFGGPVNTTCFTDSDADSGSSRLAAVVIWRRAPTAVSLGVAPTPWQAPDGWSGGRSDDGREVLYHRVRRVVRALEREYALPLPSTTHALLLLIDEPSPGASPPAIGVHTLAAPVHVRPQIDRTLDKPARLELITAASRAEHATWNAAIAAHAAVKAFLAGSSDPEQR